MGCTRIIYSRINCDLSQMILNIKLSGFLRASLHLIYYILQSFIYNIALYPATLAVYPLPHNQKNPHRAATS